MSTTADFTINSSPLGTYYSRTGATIAVLPNGTALVAWVKQVGDFSIDSEIQARWFLPDGTPAGDDFLVNSTLSDFQTRPFATATSEGKVFLHGKAVTAATATGWVCVVSFLNLWHKLPCLTF